MGSPSRKKRKIDAPVLEPVESEEDIITITPRKSTRVSKPTARLLASHGARKLSVAGIFNSQSQDEDEHPDTEPKTPARRRAVLSQPTVTPVKVARIQAIVTPVKPIARNAALQAPAKLDETPRRRAIHNADRSARRKSAKRLIERDEENSAEDDSGEEDTLAQRILSEGEDDAEERQQGDDDDETEQQEEAQPPETPLKRGRGRPRKPPKPKRTPTPPRNLPAHDKYFFDNRPGGQKTSDNTLASVPLLNHEEYFNAIQAWKDPHAAEIEHLQSLHSRAFDQWAFELDEGFNICLYGWGSKRALLTSFAEHLLTPPSDPPPTIIVINGTSPTLTLRGILLTLTSVLPALRTTTPLPTSPASLLTLILPALTTHPTRITLILHSLDAPLLRRPAAQALLATLAAHPRTALVCSADTPGFPLLWDAAQRARFGFAFHDATTFAPLDAELQGARGGGGVVDEVNGLLGRSGRRVKGREGVGYVLRSLPENARRLFGLLVAECLALEDDVGGGDGDGYGNGNGSRRGHGEEDGGADADEDDFENALAGPRRGAKGGDGGGAAVGVEYRALYQKAVQAFIATSEMAFRTLLKEFHDHAMIVSRKDGMGGEVLGVPFRRDELEAILEDLGVE